MSFNLHKTDISMEAPKTLKGLIKPPALKAGDKIVAVTPSFGCPALFPKRFEAGCKQMEDAFGISVVPSRHALKDPDWIAKNPKARAEDIIEALEDKTVHGIVCSIGGEDSVRINRFIDPQVIRSNPKVFLGYSDITTTHFHFLNAGVVSFYGPTIMAGFGENGGLFPYMEDSVRRTLFQKEPVGLIKPNAESWTTEFLDWANPDNQTIARKLNPATRPVTLQGEGKAKGQLIGGCVEVMEMMRGTDQWPDLSWFDGAILFLETAEKEFLPMYFARAIRSYGIMGILERLSAIILGRPGGNLSVEEFEGYNKALLSIVRDEFGLTSLPLVANMDFGHTDPIFTIPYGLMAELDMNTGILNIQESAVS